ncbi:MAG: nodulation protein NfeD [Bacteroidales bacterium]|nr:nodulation protein NfeD [Bacteroidales bacterium]
MFSPAPSAAEKPVIYTFDMKENIAAPIWRTTKEAFSEADTLGAALVIIQMNTYGGEVVSADSIRTLILNSRIPVSIFIDDNAASAGALIAIACDSIYMKPGAKIGAATVVNQTGEQVPDKYQSYMRATMRATAEAHGKDTIIRGGDTILVWKRDPRIAEAMVDPRLYIEGIIDTGQVLTFTTSEAIEHGYCEGAVDNISEIIEKHGFHDYEIRKYKPSGIDKIIGFLINPIVSGLLIMLIIGGIYFELQSPGVGFPLAAAIVAALLYFAPLYIEGLAEYWELIIFIVGVVLVMVEVFAIPGFGITGIAGAIAIVTGLTLSLVDNVVFDREFTGAGLSALMKALSLVLVSLFLGLIFSLWTANKLLTSSSGALSNLSLRSVQVTDEGFIGVETKQKEMIGMTGIAHTVLRPSGKVIIDDTIYDAKSEYGFIEKGEPVRVIRYETGQLYVEKDT